jgi:16S rRNA (adenine1518-N6/adenine1519-N6)-dimethyltransferase
MRRYGQHFLVREEVADAIVAAAAPDADDLVVEIGPGKGAITRKLADRAGMLVAIEIDGELAAALKREYAGRDDVRILQADVLECDITAIVDMATGVTGVAGVTGAWGAARAADAAGSTEPARPAASAGLTGRRMVVANLPYGITSPVLRRLFASSALFRQFVLMVQLEVAERLVAPPGGAGRSVLSILAQYYTEPTILMRVPPESFDPPPAVESAVVKMVVRNRPPAEVDSPPDALFRVVEAGFARRRKTIRNALIGGAADIALGLTPDDIDRALRRSLIDPMLRAEQMSLEQFSALAVALGVASTGDGR